MDIQDYIKLPYSRVLIPEDVGYSGSILEFPGCYSCGDTADETLMNLDNAMLAWIDAALSVGQEIPSPFILNNNHQVIVSLPTETYRCLMRYHKSSESIESYTSNILIKLIDKRKKSEVYLGLFEESSCGNF